MPEIKTLKAVSTATTADGKAVPASKYAGVRIKTAVRKGRRVKVILAGPRDEPGVILFFPSVEAYEASVERLLIRRQNDVDDDQQGRAEHD